MARLTVDTIPCTGSMETKKITGFNDGELNELKSMEHFEAKEKLLEMLDDRNNGVGTCWACGPGVYGLWFDNEAAYLNVGRSCD